MIGKGNKLYSILRNKCPRCHEGEFFENPKAYSWKQLGQTKKECSNCHLDFVPEPGFYFGAAYVSYGLGVALFVATFLLVYWFVPEPPAWLYVVCMVGATLILTPVNFRLSRIIYINIFHSYKSDYGIKKAA